MATSFGAANNGIDAYGQATIIVDMNGTTDYLEAYVISSVTGIGYESRFTRMTGALIAPSNGLAGGWSNDETQSYLADYTDLVAIGTSTANAKLDIWGTGSTDIFGISSSTGTRYLTVTNTGNLGIGTSTANAKLSVQGTGNLLSLFDALGN
ncbi:hypothetical protein KC906_02700, partial [Candidatus Kaiserbacteria bacterium]|nr:hypothetical protein [Candidatus Kaiserbacteria bacterium]